MWDIPFSKYVLVIRGVRLGFIRRSIFGSKEIDFVFKQVVVNNDKTSVSIAKVFALVQATTAYFKLLNI